MTTFTTMNEKEKNFLKSFDYKEILTKEKMFHEFDGEEYYSPFILEGFYVDPDEAEQILQEIDPDLYVSGTYSGIEISRKSFWE